MIFHDAIQLALAGCQVFKCFSTLGEPWPLLADSPVTIDMNLLQELLMQDRLADFDGIWQQPKRSLPISLEGVHGECQMPPDSHVPDGVSSLPS